MVMQTKAKTVIKARKRARVRSKISGTKARPRLVLSISNKHLIAQLIDDTAGKTLLYKSSVGKTLGGPKREIAKKLGEELGTQALSLKINTIVFDRGHRTYHGLVKEFAEAVRSSGIKF